jgi:hypothetical protein
LFILEETLLDNGVATPLNQIQFPDGNQAMSAFSVYIKQSDNHIITVFHIQNPLQAIAQK